MTGKGLGVTDLITSYGLQRCMSWRYDYFSIDDDVEATICCWEQSKDVCYDAGRSRHLTSICLLYLVALLGLSFFCCPLGSAYSSYHHAIEGHAESAGRLNFIFRVICVSDLRSLDAIHRE
jgi:hypothetical protein